MNATATPTLPILAKSYDFLQDPTGWMMSEKLDGIRAIWDGEKFISREGNVIAAPEWFTADLPAIALDGELWIGRGQFQRVASEVPTGWFQGVSFAVFDAPEVAGGFRARHAAAAAAVAGCAHAAPAVQIEVTSRQHMRETFHAITAAGGEGLIIRDPSATYRAGRSNGFQKIKKTDDDEGVMVSHNGKAMVIAWDGKQIKLPMTADIRQAPPAIGSKITFKFNGLTSSGTPRHAAFVAVRDYE